MPWFVLHVRPRTEKKLAEYCEGAGLAYYLPLRSETKVYQRRRVVVDKPLFTGYFFVAFTREQRLGLLQLNYHVRILEVEDQRKLLRELVQIRRALTVDPTLGACAALETGRWVRIKGGAFQGIVGKVQSMRTRSRVVLNVEMIGRALSVEIERELLEPSEAPE